MHVRLFAPIARGAVMDRPLIRPARPELLLDKPLNQRHPRIRYELARQRELVLPVRVPVGPLVLIGRAPKLRRVLARPGRHVAVAARLDLAVRSSVNLPSRSMYCACSSAAPLPPRVDLHVVRGHRLPQASKHAPLRSGMRTAQQGPAESRIFSAPGAERERANKRPIESRVFLRFLLFSQHRFPALRET